MERPQISTLKTVLNDIIYPIKFLDPDVQEW